MLQNALTVITKIKREEVEALRTFLTVIGKDIKGKRDNKYVLFSELETTHFARWVIINDYGEPHLMFSSNHDGTWEEYIDLLITKIGPALDEIWGRCEGYPGGRTQNPEQFRAAFKQYISQHYYEADTFYLGYRGVKVTELKGYLKIQERVQELLDMPVIRHAIRDTLASFPMKAQVQSAFAPISQALSGIFTLARVIVDTIGYFVVLAFIRPNQLRARGVPRINYKTPPPEVADNYKADMEDLISQNQMTVITRIKPGRLLMLKFVLAFVHCAARHLFNQGSLSNIATIHFARWIIIDDGTHLLFESNYDSTWESYIGDFIDKVSSGMNAIWRHSVDFPETTGLVITEHGCKDVDAFKRYIRWNQIEAQTFYSAYPKTTVRNLLSAVHIGQSLNQEDIEAWLRRF
ncbi:MAG: hypothetical protein U0694_13530 [Anaerolineae bacterium]